MCIIIFIVTHKNILIQPVINWISIPFFGTYYLSCMRTYLSTTKKLFYGFLYNKRFTYYNGYSDYIMFIQYQVIQTAPFYSKIIKN